MVTIGGIAGGEARIGGNGALVAAAVVLVLAMPLTLVTLVEGTAQPLDRAAFAWIVTLCALLHATAFLNRWAPLTAFVVGSALMLVLALTPIPELSSAAMMPSSLAYLPLVWRMAADDSRTRSTAALAVGFAGAALITAVDAVQGGAREPLLLIVEAGALAAGILAAWALGSLSKQRRLAEAERVEERARRAVAEERERIGRDLHDIVSHSLAVMIAQAEAARVLARGSGADDALEKVAETGRSAMQGLRGMLRVLDDPGRRPLAPTPGIDGILALVERARSADHSIRLTVRGDPGTVEPDAGIAAYRAVQEALTNAVRHVAPPLRIDVDIAWEAAEVAVTVHDDGGSGARPATGGEQAGTGLIGMAEGIERAGGALSIRRGRGWRLRVVLPAAEPS
ncbi:sensor histidine kinase [Gulosibacter sp. 10]|uniref:sensor histidine kinase n=1 Tax=Gulosibacter sp. 10 TaxID=1255570 RepID=UPI00097EA66A|nr:histidine kinase [Gulosibacter sp. 10]SJM70425.1 Putative two-component system sensor kinase [Gulosibacter sp. 10]